MASRNYVFSVVHDFYSSISRIEHHVADDALQCMNWRLIELNVFCEFTSIVCHDGQFHSALSFPIRFGKDSCSSSNILPTITSMLLQHTNRFGARAKSAFA